MGVVMANKSGARLIVQCRLRTVATVDIPRRVCRSETWREGSACDYTTSASSLKHEHAVPNTQPIHRSLVAVPAPRPCAETPTHHDRDQKRLRGVSAHDADGLIQHALDRVSMIDRRRRDRTCDVGRRRIMRAASGVVGRRGRGKRRLHREIPLRGDECGVAAMQRRVIRADCRRHACRCLLSARGSGAFAPLPGPIMRRSYLPSLSASPGSARSTLCQASLVAALAFSQPSLD